MNILEIMLLYFNYYYKSIIIILNLIHIIPTPLDSIPFLLLFDVLYSHIFIYINITKFNIN